MAKPIDSLFFLIDFLAVFAGALAGALGAVRDTRHEYDFIGATGLALVASLGGGIIRDIILQKGPPLAFADSRYLVLALTGAVAGITIASRAGENTERALVLVDAAALGLFAVAGSTRALEANLSWVSSLLLGVVTAVGGGALRDVLGGRTPRIFERGELYAVPAILGSIVFLVSNTAELPRRASTVLGISAAFGLRLLAWRYGWTTRPLRRDS